MLDARRLQRTVGDGFVAEAVGNLQEAWMRPADTLLDDDQLLAAVYDALATRHPQSWTRGRRGVPAEMVLRLLVLKDLRNWSYATLEREVRMNLGYRAFTRVGGDKVPDATTLGRGGFAVAPEVVERLHQRLVATARNAQVVKGRRMRVDTTVVETNIHYPTKDKLLSVFEPSTEVIARAKRASRPSLARW